MSADRLSDRALGRATLSRQLLLERTAMEPLAAVEHLVGLQAQIPLDPYTALWSRLDGFRPKEVGRLLEERALVRIVVMRGTIHLLSAEDALVLRPLMQPVLDAELARHGEFKDVLNRLDLVSLMARLRPLVVEAGPVSPTGLRALIEAELPELDARALAYACRNLPASRGVGQDRAGAHDAPRQLAGPASRRATLVGRRGAALLRRLRPGLRGGRRRLVPADGDEGGGGPPAPEAPPVPRRTGPRAVGSPGRGAARP